MKRCDRQWLFVPREDIDLFYGVLLYWAGPIYAFCVWLMLSTSRRASEILRLRVCDIFLQEGRHHDQAYVLLQKRQSEAEIPGMGKLGSDEVAARLSHEAVATIEMIKKKGLHRIQNQALTGYSQKITDLNLHKKPCTAPSNYEWPSGADSLLFPSRRGSRAGWITRQTAWNSIKRAREIMWSLTSKKRYHPATQYSHVTLHGATRHSSAALFLENPSSSKDRPSVECILELQNREDRKTFEKHYYHLGQQKMDEALAFGSIPSPFAPEPAASNLNTETTPSSDVVKEANTSGDKRRPTEK